MPRMSASWKASVPIDVDATWPVIATIGTESMYASAIGVTKFVAPGPDVAMHTPTCSRDRTRLCAPVIVVLARFVVARLTDPATSDGVTVVPLTPCPFLLLVFCAARVKPRAGVPRRGRPRWIRPETKKPLGPGRAHRGVARGLASDRVPPDYEERAHSPTVPRGPPGVNRRLRASRPSGRRSVSWDGPPCPLSRRPRPRRPSRPAAP